MLPELASLTITDIILDMGILCLPAAFPLGPDALILCPLGVDSVA